MRCTVVYRLALREDQRTEDRGQRTVKKPLLSSVLCPLSSVLLAAACLAWGSAALAQEGQWKVYISSGLKSSRAGDQAAARQYLTKALQQAEEFPAGDPRRGLTLSYLALVSFKQGQKADAERFAGQALAVFDALPSGVALPASVARGLNVVGLVAQGFKDYAKADALYQRAAAVEAKAVGSNKLALTQYLGNRAALYEAQGRYEEAEGLRKEQITALDVKKNSKHTAPAASAHQALGHLYLAWGKPNLAEPQLLQAVELRRTVGKSDVLALAGTLSEMGRFYFEQKKFAHAEPYFSEALQLREEHLGTLPVERQAELAEAYHNQASVYLALNHFVRAESLLKKALAIREKVAPGGDLRTADTLHHLGTLHDAQKRYPQALEHHKRALAIQEKLLGANHADVATAVETLASVYAHLGDAKQAEQSYKRALAIREKALGADSRGVAVTLHHLANFYRDQKRYAEAEPLYKRALAIKEKSQGKEHATLAPLLDSYAQLLRELKRPDEAAKLDARAKAIYAKMPIKTVQRSRGH